MVEGTTTGYRPYLEKIESDLALALEKHWITWEDHRKYHTMVVRLIRKKNLTQEDKTRALLGASVLFSDLRGL